MLLINLHNGDVLEARKVWFEGTDLCWLNGWSAYPERIHMSCVVFIEVIEK